MKLLSPVRSPEFFQSRNGSTFLSFSNQPFYKLQGWSTKALRICDYREFPEVPAVVGEFVLPSESCGRLKLCNEWAGGQLPQRSFFDTGQYLIFHLRSWKPELILNFSISFKTLSIISSFFSYILILNPYNLSLGLLAMAYYLGVMLNSLIPYCYIPHRSHQSDILKYTLGLTIPLLKIHQCLPSSTVQSQNYLAWCEFLYELALAYTFLPTLCLPIQTIWSY